MQNCWEKKPQMRPSASEIVERLVGPSIAAKTTSSTIDWDDKFTSKFRRSLQAKPLLPSVTQIERTLFGDEAVQACRQCLPDPKGEQAISPLLGHPKRRYEEEKSDSNLEDAMRAQQPVAKKSKPTTEILSE